MRRRPVSRHAQVSGSSRRSLRTPGLIRRGRRSTATAAVLALVAVSFSIPTGASAATAPAKHEITANWADTPAPTGRPYGATRTAEFHINTNDAGRPLRQRSGRQRPGDTHGDQRRLRQRPGGMQDKAA